MIKSVVKSILVLVTVGLIGYWLGLGLAGGNEVDLMEPEEPVPTTEPEPEAETESDREPAPTTEPEPEPQVRNYVEEWQGLTAQAEYQGSARWSYQVTGELPNKCYDYDYLLIKTGDGLETRSSDPSRVDLEFTVVLPEERCDEDEPLPVEVEGEFEAPIHTAFVFLGDLPVEPVVRLSQGFTVRARYVEPELWSYSVQGQLPNDCWEAETTIEIDNDGYPVPVELILDLIEPVDAVACQSPHMVDLGGEFRTGPGISFDFSVEGDDPDETKADSESATDSDQDKDIDEE